MTVRDFTDEKMEGLDVRLVPISGSQIQALGSLERAFSGLKADFWRDYRVDHDDRIAGGLYRLCSTLQMIIEQWQDDTGGRRTRRGTPTGARADRPEVGSRPTKRRRLAALTLQLPSASE
jgi:hypothetical protein